MKHQASDRIICALDYAQPQHAQELVKELEGLVKFFKVGMLLQFTGGLDFINWLRNRNHHIFLDMKYYDIPETVASVVKEVANIGVDFLTIHGHSRVIAQAAEAKKGTSLKLMAVTVLTSMDVEDLPGGNDYSKVEELVLKKAQDALENGCDGVIASGNEAAALKRNLPPESILITPGIRSTQGSINEHKRVMTAKEAIANGADYLVIGRPITESHQPRQAAAAFIEEIEEALS